MIFCSQTSTSAVSTMGDVIMCVETQWAALNAAARKATSCWPMRELVKVSNPCDYLFVAFLHVWLFTGFCFLPESALSGQTGKSSFYNGKSSLLILIGLNMSWGHCKYSIYHSCDRIFSITPFSKWSLNCRKALNHSRVWIMQYLSWLREV